MALRAYVDKVGPALPAAWLNQVDVLANARLTGADTGAVNAYVVPLPAGNSFTLAVGALVLFTTPNTNTGAATLNVGGTGAIAIVGRGGAASSGGEITSVGWNLAQYTGTAWQTVGTGATPDKVRTAAETTAGVIPVNYAIPSHAAVGSIIVDRYGSNVTPGTTDMSSALQAAVNVMLSASGSSQLSCPVVFLGTAYSIVTPPTFGPYTANLLGIDIAGQGVGTQIINNAPAGTAATFDMSARSGWRIRDLLICGNSVHKNDGIYAGLDTGNISTLTVTAGGSGYVNGTYIGVPLTGGSGTNAKATIVVSGGAVTSATIVIPQGGQNYLVTDVGLSASNVNLGGSGAGFTASVASLTGLSNLWRVERVTSFAVGVSLKIRNTSSYKVDRFLTWPTGLDPTLLKVPQTVTLTDVNHGIWITGSFAQLGYIADSYCLPRSSFAANARGLKADATNCTTLTVLNCDFESGNAVQGIGIDCANLNSANFVNVFNESSIAQFSNCFSCNFQIFNGGIGGGITLASNCVNNNFSGTAQTGASGSLTADATCVSNNFIGSTFNSITADAAATPNLYINTAAATRGNVTGLTPKTRLVPSSGGTITPNMRTFRFYDLNVVPSAGVLNFTVANPTNLDATVDGEIIYVLFRNTGATNWTGTVTFGTLYKVAAFTTLNAGLNRTYAFEYDNATNVLRQIAATTDVSN